VTPMLPSWPTPLQALALVASPRLGLQHLWPHGCERKVARKKIIVKVLVITWRSEISNYVLSP